MPCFFNQIIKFYFQTTRYAETGDKTLISDILAKQNRTKVGGTKLFEKFEFGLLFSEIFETY